MKDKLGALRQFPMLILVSLRLKGSDDDIDMKNNVPPQKHILLHQVHVV